MSGLNVIERDAILRQMARLSERVFQLERILNGQPIGTARLADAVITEAKIEDASITNAKIANLAVDSAKVDSIDVGKINATQLDALATNTGTLNVDESVTVGGSANGKVYVKDSSNVTKVQLDNTGITVSSGKVTIKDEDESSVIDNLGLVSATSFPITGLTYDALNQTISTAEPNWTDVTNASLTFTLDRATTILINVKSTFWGDGAAYPQDALLRITIDSESETGTSNRIWFRDTVLDFAVTGSMHRLVSLAAGSHTIKLRATCNGGGTMNIYNYYMSFVSFGK